MKIVLSGGGTAGHINPALALAEELQRRGHTVDFAGTPQGVESRLVTEAGIPFTAFEATGFDRSRPASLFKGVSKILKSTKKARDWFKSIEPDVVVGFGGYVSIPVGRAASSLNIPLVVHEQNSVAGMANKYLGKEAQAVALTYDINKDAFGDSSKVVVTGNPVRTSVIEASREAGREMLDISEDSLVLLVFGGSLGARHINNALVALKDRLLEKEGLVVVQVSGPKEYEAVKEALALTPDQEKRWKLFSYQDRMGETMAASDVVVSRAGATSLAEISVRRIPAVLVPFPYATEDHQTTNAKAYVDKGAAYMIADDLVESDQFAELLFSLLNSEEARNNMIAAAATFETQNAASRLADVVIKAANR